MESMGQQRVCPIDSYTLVLQMLERRICLLVGDALSGAVMSAATWLATLSVDPSWLMPAAIHSRSA
jgi:hypothetical protein